MCIHGGITRECVGVAPQLAAGDSFGVWNCCVSCVQEPQFFLLNTIVLCVNLVTKYICIFGVKKG